MLGKYALRFSNMQYGVLSMFAYCILDRTGIDVVLNCRLRHAWFRWFASRQHSAMSSMQRLVALQSPCTRGCHLHSRVPSSDASSTVSSRRSASICSRIFSFRLLWLIYPKFILVVTVAIRSMIRATNMHKDKHKWLKPCNLYADSVDVQQTFGSYRLLDYGQRAYKRD